MFDTADFDLQILSPSRRQSVCPASSGAIFLLDAFDPIVIKQAAQRSVESACTQDDPPCAHLLHILEDRITMPWLVGEAEQDQQHRFTDRETLHYYLSRHVAMRHIDAHAVQCQGLFLGGLQSRRSDRKSTRLN